MVVVVFFQKITSKNALWIRNCSANSETITSHAFGGLAGSRRTLLYTQQRAAGGRHGCHPESMTAYKNPAPSIDEYLREEQLCQISPRSDLKRQNLRLFEERRPNRNKNIMMSSGMRSVPDLNTHENKLVSK